ncbi:MAG: hypothetical protein CM15mP8_2520 [Methanobacteriota archaeon]|nr:MAG: hypothetical protein CM15mP8_2520 [Euryarchaeota archaeon]
MIGMSLQSTRIVIVERSQAQELKPLNQDEIDDRDFVGSLETSWGNMSG